MRPFTPVARGRRACIAAGLVLLSLRGFAAGAWAGTQPGFIGMVTDSARVFAVPRVPRPAYRVPVVEPTFGTRIVRIANDVGLPTSPVSGTWGADARHTYSRQQPWNSDGTLMVIQNRAAGSPSKLFLDGETYRPRFGAPPGSPLYDYRWHPSPVHASEMINVTRSGGQLMWYDVVKGTPTRTWTLPITADYGIGSGEGNVSADGRFVVLSDDTRMVVVDMDPQLPNAPPYPYRRIGPVYTFPPCSLDAASPYTCPVGNVSISPSGRYIDVKYAAVSTGAAGCDTLCDMHRIFSVDSGLVIRPHNMASASARCGSFAARPNGWIFPLKHADMARDPYDHDEDVIIGGRACPGSRLGHVVKVRLRDGAVTSLTDPANEASYMHGSGRNTARPGWFYVTYGRDPSQARRRFWGEVVAIKIDGSGAVQRLAHYHSSASTYRAEAQAVPSPDGRRVVFASDWQDFCSPPCGPRSVFEDYVIDARPTGESRPAAGRGVR